MESVRPLAIVTGASSGIGLELAREAATRGYDLIIAADEPLDAAAQTLRALGAEVEAVQADLATRAGVELLFSAARDRPTSTRCWPTPDTAWARVSSTRNSPKCST